MGPPEKKERQQLWPHPVGGRHDCGRLPTSRALWGEVCGPWTPEQELRPRCAESSTGLAAGGTQ